MKKYHLSPNQCNKYKNYKQTYQNLNTGQRIKPHTHKNKNAVFVDILRDYAMTLLVDHNFNNNIIIRIMDLKNRIIRG